MWAADNSLLYEQETEVRQKDDRKVFDAVDQVIALCIPDFYSYFSFIYIVCILCASVTSSVSVFFSASM